MLAGIKIKTNAQNYYKYLNNTYIIIYLILKQSKSTLPHSVVL